ncbi:methyltransferase domain-containing protein [Pedobacter arcticus]|uniref:methyltransferase domain-containing protein n=1 Tax=Pedobacter arcticus TaxID=752140 RepID=UPI000307722F|nr:methyltransferase domain-containing protein [Pedobacter arcticus]
MSEKHYNINYLENTGLFLKNLKQHSYHPFEKKRGPILDLGCGTGLDVIKMSELFHSSKIIGIDHDPVMLEKGIAESKGNQNIEFIQSESDNIPYNDGFFAGIRAERLMQHLKNPEKTIREVYRALMPEHPFAIIETDWAGLVIYNENNGISNKINKFLTEEKINNGYASRKLRFYLKGADFKDINIEVFPFVLKSLKEANEYLWLEIIINEASEKGYLTKLEKDLFIESLRDADSENYFACSINMVIVTSVK